MKRPDGDPAPPRTVAPGAYEFVGCTNSNRREPRSIEVVWWDPQRSSSAASTFGLRRDDLIVKDGDMFAVEERLADYERWRRDRAEAVETGAATEACGCRRRRPGRRRRPSSASTRTSQRAERSTSWSWLAPAGGPRGPRFGTLVHAVLATVTLDARRRRARGRGNAGTNTIVHRGRSPRRRRGCQRSTRTRPHDARPARRRRLA